MPPGPSPRLEHVGAGAGRPEGCGRAAGRGARGCEKGQPRGAPAKQVPAAVILLAASRGRESHSCSPTGHLCEQHKGPFSPSRCYVISSLPGTGCADTAQALPSMVVREWFSQSWAWCRHPGLKPSLQFHCPRKGSGCAAQQAPGLPATVQGGCSTSITAEAWPKGSTVQLWHCRGVQSGAGDFQHSLRRPPSRNGLKRSNCSGSTVEGWSPPRTEMLSGHTAHSHCTPATGGRAKPQLSLGTTQPPAQQLAKQQLITMLTTCQCPSEELSHHRATARDHPHLLVLTEPGKCSLFPLSDHTPNSRGATQPHWLPDAGTGVSAGTKTPPSCASTGRERRLAASRTGTTSTASLLPAQHQQLRAAKNDGSALQKLLLTTSRSALCLLASFPRTNEKLHRENIYEQLQSFSFSFGEHLKENSVRERIHVPQLLGDHKPGLRVHQREVTKRFNVGGEEQWESLRRRRKALAFAVLFFPWFSLAGRAEPLLATDLCFK